MRFCRYETEYECYLKETAKRHPIGMQEFHDKMEVILSRRIHNDCGNSFLAGYKLLFDIGWYEINRPYYNIYPVALNGFSRMSLDVPCNSIEFPVDSLCICLPESNTFTGYVCNNGPLVRFSNILITKGMERIIFIGKSNNEIFVPIDVKKEIGENKSSTVSSMIESVLSLRLYSEFDKKLLSRLFRVALSVSVIAQNDTIGIVHNDVLPKDRISFMEETNANKRKAMIRRARKKGMNGWTIGLNYEMQKKTSPHYRRPHLRMQMCGKGRTEARIVEVRGHYVKPKEITDVPTDYLDGKPDDKE